MVGGRGQQGWSTVALKIVAGGAYDSKNTRDVPGAQPLDGQFLRLREVLRMTKRRTYQLLVLDGCPAIGEQESEPFLLIKLPSPTLPPDYPQ